MKKNKLLSYREHCHSFLKQDLLEYENSLKLILDKNVNIVCFGGSQALSLFLKNTIVKPDFICDNDQKKWGSYFTEYPIYSQKAIQDSQKPCFIIVTSIYYKEIYTQLIDEKNVMALYPAYLLKLSSSKFCGNSQKLSQKQKKIENQYIKVEFLDDDNSVNETLFLDAVSNVDNYIIDCNKPKKILFQYTPFNSNEQTFLQFIEYFLVYTFIHTTKIEISFKVQAKYQKKIYTLLRETISQENYEKLQYVTSTQKFIKKNDHAIIIHAFFQDIFELILEEISCIKDRFDIYISLNFNFNSDYIKTLTNRFSNATLFIFDNRGRDILPFLNIFNKIYPMKYKTILKLHTKKSLHNSNGIEWGKYLREHLIGNTLEILNLFQTDLNMGIVVAKGNALTVNSSLKSNEKYYTLLSHLLDIPFNDSCNFPAGSIFWFRTQALSQLAQGKINSNCFRLEKGLLDGAMEHAAERLFGALCSYNQFKIYEI